MLCRKWLALKSGIGTDFRSPVGRGVAMWMEEWHLVTLSPELYSCAFCVNVIGSTLPGQKSQFGFKGPLHNYVVIHLATVLLTLTSEEVPSHSNNHVGRCIP